MALATTHVAISIFKTLNKIYAKIYHQICLLIRRHFSPLLVINLVHYLGEQFLISWVRHIIKQNFNHHALKCFFSFLLVYNVVNNLHYLFSQNVKDLLISRGGLDQNQNDTLIFSERHSFFKVRNRKVSYDKNNNNNNKIGSWVSL